MNLYFLPVLPAETSETCRGKRLDKKSVLEWKAPLKIPLILSDLAESEEQEKKTLHHVYISEDCKAKGNDAESIFLHIASKLGYRQKRIKDAQRYDYLYHVDAMLKNEEEGEIWADIKSMRSLRRGWKPQSEFMWIELNEGGWLFGGKSSIIAQQVCDDTFALFDRLALAKYVQSTVQTSTNVVKNPEESFEKVYLRESRNASGSISFVCALSLLDTREAFQNAGCGIWSLS